MTANLYLFEKLLTASSEKQIFSFLDQQCDQLGYSCYFYSSLRGDRGSERLFKEKSQIVEGDNLIKQNAFTTYPSSWIYRYQEARHVQVDPVVKRVSTSNLPVFWDDITRNAPKQSCSMRHASMGLPME